MAVDSAGTGGKTAEKSQPASKRRVAPVEPVLSTQSPRSEGQSLPVEGLLGSDYSQSTFEHHAALLGDPRMSHPMYTTQRRAIAMKLQRDYGNRYVQRLVDHISRKRAEVVQTKLTVGPAGDKYEQEADSVAKEVMGKLGSPNAEVPQRQEEEEELQMQPVAQRQEEEEELDMKPVAQRQEEEEELDMKPVAQRQIPAEGGDVDREVESTIQQAKGGGQALPGKVQSSMEGAFGADFSGVKVHHDAQADTLNDSMSSVAFTTGQDIFFRKGDYNPGSPAGQELLAHELTHVVQQGGATPNNVQVRLTGQPERTYGGSGERNTNADLPAEVSPVTRRSVQRELIPDAKQAFKSAISENATDYKDLETSTDQLIPPANQEKVVDVTSWFKKLTSAISSLFKGEQKGPSPADKLKDFLRAYLLGQYAGVLQGKKDKKIVVSDEDRDNKYLNKALQVRNKYMALLGKGVAAPETQAFLKEEGFEGGVIVTAKEQEKELAKGPRIDVRATFIGGPILGIDVRAHLFIVYTSSEGKQTYFRGGPDENDFTVADKGDYTPGTVDWDPSAPSKTVLQGEPAAKKLDSLIEATSVIDRMKVPYVGFKMTNPLVTGSLISGENCNATAWTILDRAGIPKKKPSGVHPGWGLRLGDLLKQGEDIAPEEVDAETGEPYVIKNDDAQLYRDRDEIEKLTKLSAGTEVSQLLASDQMAKIKTSDDTIGWISVADIAKPRAKGKLYKVAGSETDVIPTFAVDSFRQADALVVGGQTVEVLAFEDPGLVKIRFWEGSDEYEGRILETSLEGVNAKEDDSKGGSQLLKPPSGKSIPFLDMSGGDTLESLEVPTRIEILDPMYPDGLEGWENVEVKNLDSGQTGYINYTDLKKYL